MPKYSIYASIRNPDGREIGKLELQTINDSMEAEQLVEEFGKIMHEFPSVQTMIKAIKYSSGYEKDELLIVIMKEIVI